jgi:hypothetical protein
VGQPHDEEPQRQRSIAALKRRAAALGIAAMPTAIPVGKQPSLGFFSLKPM